MSKLFYASAASLALIAAVFVFAAPQRADAQENCNYNASDAAANCKAAAKDYFQKTFGSQSDTYEDVDKRVNTAKDVVNECMNCATQKTDQKESGN